MKENEINQIDYYSLSNIQIPSNSSIPKLTTAHELLVDRFSIELSQIKKRRRIELAIGDKVCFVKPSSDLEPIPKIDRNIAACFYSLICLTFE